MGSIDEKAIQNLSLIVNLSKLLQKGNEKDKNNIVNSFPSFMWLIRDFSLRLVDEHGIKINAKEYLNKVLEIKEGHSDLTLRKNNVRI